MDTFNSIEQDSSVPIALSKNVNHIQESLKDSPNLSQSRKNARSKPLARTYFVAKKVETYSLDELGTIEKARMHRDANRPLHIINELNDSVKFCHCCDLPCEKKGVIEPFNVCDDADIYAECGVGISLYFFFFKFVILVCFLGLLSLSVVLMVLNMEYSSGIKDVCNSKFKNSNVTKIGNCYGYVSEKNNDENYYKMFNQWLQRFSSDNIFIYKKLHIQFIGRRNQNVDDVLVNYSLVNFLFLITTFVLNIIFLFLIRAQIKRLKLNNITIRDYTVLISNAKSIITSYIDLKYKSEFNVRESQIGVENFNEFKIYVNDYIKGDKDLLDINIEHINICYRLGDYLTYMEKFEEKKRQIFQINNNPTTIEKNKNLPDNEKRYYKYLLGFLGIYCCCSIKGKTLEELNKKKEELNQKLNEEELRIRGKIKKEDFTNYMLISFNKIQDKEGFLSYYPHNFFGNIGFFFRNIQYYIFPCCVDKEERKKFWKAKGINAKDPPEPEDILWENFSYSFIMRIQYTFTTYLICILIIALSFAIVLGLSLVQENLYSDDKENGDTNIFLKYLTSLSITVVLSIINLVIEMALEKLTYREKPISKSNYVLSLSIKISILTFFNSAVIPLICKLIIAERQKDNQDESITYFVKRKRDDPLIDDMFVYFLVNAIITPLLWILNFPYWYKKIRICCIERRQRKYPNKPAHHMTQRDLNELYQYPDMDLAYKLSYLMKTLSMCFFFYPIFPSGFILAFIGFVFAYWVEKYVFTHQIKRPDMLDEIIEKYYANYFIVVLFVGGVGDYIFLNGAYDTNKWCLVNIILFGALIIIPYSKLINCNYVDKDVKFRERPLSDVYFTFYNDYQRQNPLTKKLGLETYLNELKKKGYLTENAFNIAMDNIEKLNLMEMYYGMSKGDMATVQQSILANVPSDSIINVGNLRGTFLGTGGINETVIRPELNDNQEEKLRKKNFFESQIMNLFGKGTTNKEIGEISSEIKREGNDSILEIKNSKVDEVDKLAAKIGELPVTKSIYKSDDKDTNNN